MELTALPNTKQVDPILLDILQAFVAFLVDYLGILPLLATPSLHELLKEKPSNGLKPEPDALAH